MTVIASTSHDTSSTAYAGVNKSSGGGAETTSTGSYGQQETEAGGAASSGSATSQAPVDSRPSTVTVNLHGKLVTLHLLDTSSLKPIHVSELPEDRYQDYVERTERFIEMTSRGLEGRYRQEPERPDLSNYPGNKPYATVLAGNNLVATIDNQGVVGSWGALDAELLDKLPGSVNGTNGPDLAQARAERIAAALGGRALIEPTAMTQSEFNALPPIEKPQATIDYEAMKSDPTYEWLQNMLEQLEHTKQMRAEYLAQQQTGIDSAA